MTGLRALADLDPSARHLEGYLFPDTYRFARGTGEGEIADARFHEAIIRSHAKLSYEQAADWLASPSRGAAASAAVPVTDRADALAWLDARRRPDKANGPTQP